MVPGKVNVEGERVVEVREGDPVLGPQRLTDDDLVDVIKLIPIFVPIISKLTINCKACSRLNYHAHIHPGKQHGYRGCI